MLELDEVRSHLETLKLVTAADVLESRLQQATQKQLTYVAFLADLLGEEIAERRKRNIQTKMRMARLPYQKTLEEFDFTFQPSVDKKLVSELATMNFVRQASNVVFLGPTGPVPWYSSSLFGHSKGLIPGGLHVNSADYAQVTVTTRKIRPFANGGYKN